MKRLLRKKILIPALLVLVIGGGGGSLAAYLHLQNTSNKTDGKKSGKYYNRNTNHADSKVPKSDGKPKNGNPSAKGGGGDASATPSSNVRPGTPVGTFVSNHRPNLSGHPAPNTETSTCGTTPGASCRITFTMGSTVKSLPVHTTDGNGNTNWNWKVQDIGLTAGTWHVKAVATNGSLSSSASDATNLVVNP